MFRTNWIKMPSEIDRSVNFYRTMPDAGMFEARFVQRNDDKIIVYVSSHTGCNKSCRMCHLTATNQTMMQESSLSDFNEQSKTILEHAIDNTKASNIRKINYNFMARGEPLASSVVLDGINNGLFSMLDRNARMSGFSNLKNVSLNISSIMPAEMHERSLIDVLGEKANLYYSLYSLNPSFRKRWLPKAIDPEISFRKIKEWANYISYLDTTIYDGAKLPKIVFHWAFIENENDSEEDLIRILDKINDYDLKCHFNIVRYNSHSVKTGDETDEVLIHHLYSLIKERHPNTKIIPRVGKDVKASCGMFLT